jgi:hypothetical protein
MLRPGRFPFRVRPANPAASTYVYADMGKAAVAVAALALLLATGAQPSVGLWPPWVTLSSGGAVPVPGGGTAGAVILGSRAALAHYEAVALEVGHVGCCDWQQSFNWKRDVVLLVVARNQAAFPEVVGLRRERDLLRVTIGAPLADTTPVLAPTWTALRISRQLLGQSLPRRINVAVTRAR